VDCGEQSVADLYDATMANPLMGIRGLHTHFDQVQSISSRGP
jgi:hypothetical protein